MPERWRRHDLLRVEPAEWSEMLGTRPELAARSHVAGWAVRGWPLVVRRQNAGDAPGLVPLGLPLPPTCGKLRLAVQLSPGAIHDRMPPQTLRAARRAAPRGWQPAVKALLDVADQIGVEPGVFGSLLWQWLTGLPYLSETSDLDLLWPVPDLGTALDLVRRLAGAEGTSPVRFDGEILLPDGGGVQWRELQARPAEVLVKTDFGVELRSLVALFPAATPLAAAA